MTLADVFHLPARKSDGYTYLIVFFFIIFFIAYFESRELSVNASPPTPRPDPPTSTTTTTTFASYLVNPADIIINILVDFLAVWRALSLYDV